MQADLPERDLERVFSIVKPNKVVAAALPDCVGGPIEASEASGLAPVHQIEQWRWDPLS